MGESLKQVYDSLMSFMRNMEINITETRGLRLPTLSHDAYIFKPSIDLQLYDEGHKEWPRRVLIETSEKSRDESDNEIDPKPRSTVISVRPRHVDARRSGFAPVVPPQFPFVPLEGKSLRVNTMVPYQERSGDGTRLKKRKPTYLVRKEEVHELEEQVQALRKELAALQEAKDHANTDLTEAKNQVLKEGIRRHQLTVASTHAMLYSHLSSQQDNPMYTPIYLPKQWAKRRQALVNMKDGKFRQCYNYLAARCRHLDMSKDHSTIDQFEDADGNFICHRFDVIHFRGAQSLQQVYDALTFFTFNMEISVSETLGDITVRDDYDSLNDGWYISNHRFVSNHDGDTSEVNTVSFAQCFGDNNEFEDSTCAIVAVDSIDEDDLHPYESLSHVRRDITAAIVLTEEVNRDTTSPSSSDLSDVDDVVVVMRRAAFMKLYRPSFSVGEEVLLNMCDRIAQWSNVMLQTMHEMIDARVKK